MPNAIIILGSSRNDGNTRQMVDYIVSQTGMEVINLNDKNISYYDYEHQNQGDDFLPLMEKIVTYDLIIFATPVYWYSMSAVMKTFFDRISDLLSIRKELGRQLKGKAMALISCSNEDDLIEGFSMPFRESAKYLHMDFLDECHTWLDSPEVEISQEVKGNLDVFVKKLTKVAK